MQMRISIMLATIALTWNLLGRLSSHYGLSGGNQPKSVTPMAAPVVRRRDRFLLAWELKRP
jgi:hypothetical protein